jgi:hypothetical protein
MKTIRASLIFLSLMLNLANCAWPGCNGIPSLALAEAKGESARKIDEYGDLIQEDEAARLDAFEAELRRVPGSRAYIIAYGGRHDPLGKARRYAHRAKVYLVEARGITATRIVPIAGGHRENLAVELWVVPAGAQAPTPAPTVKVEQSDYDRAIKYDEYNYGYEGSWNSYELPSVRLDGFAAALRAQAGARGYVVAYALNGDDRTGIERDPPSKARRIASDERTDLIKHGGIAPSRIVALDGGYSNERTVVLWIVPPGVRPPTVRRGRTG